MPLPIDYLGWLGAAALVTAYWLVSTRKTTGDSTRYQVLNLIGGALVLINSLYYGAYPSVAVNGLWVAIGASALAARSRKV
jgi:predicted membrane protein